MSNFAHYGTFQCDIYKDIRLWIELGYCLSWYDSLFWDFGHFMRIIVIDLYFYIDKHYKKKDWPPRNMITHYYNVQNMNDNINMDSTIQVNQCSWLIN